MEITINVTESRFKDVLEKELEAFTKDELHAIVRDCLIKCMSDKETLASLFISEGSNYYSGEYRYANDLLKRAAETINLSPVFEDIQKKAIEYLKNNEGRIINQLFLDIFVNGLSHDLQYNSTFCENLKHELIYALNNK